MKNYIFVIVLGIIAMALMVVLTPYILVKGAVCTLVSVLKQATEAYLRGVEELLAEKGNRTTL